MQLQRAGMAAAAAVSDGIALQTLGSGHMMLQRADLASMAAAAGAVVSDGIALRTAGSARANAFSSAEAASPLSDPLTLVSSPSSSGPDT